MIAMISDVHANAAALEAVLRDIRRRPVREIYCLGDCIGYNASPLRTLELMRKKGVVSIKGNHDMMATGELPIAQCGPHGRQAMMWTRSVLDRSSIEFLRALPETLRVGRDLLMIHSRLNDPIGYLRNEEEYREQREAIRHYDDRVRICFTGHTHKPRLVAVSEDGRVQIASPSEAVLHAGHFYFINPGSVGHPRRSDYRASYVIFDRNTRRVQWLRVAYDKASMRAENLRNGIETELGPSVTRYAWNRVADRCKAILRGAS